MQKVFYPEGLVYYPKTHFFEPQNTYYFHSSAALFNDLLEFGVPDGTTLNRLLTVRERLYACCDVFKGV